MYKRQGVSRAAWNTRDGLGILSQVLNNWKELDSLKKENESLKAEQSGYSEISVSYTHLDVYKRQVL